ncbi:Uncharacterised protein g4543 [Pycnogonum litorale]
MTERQINSIFEDGVDSLQSEPGTSNSSAHASSNRHRSDSLCIDQITPNIIVQLFSPLVTSQNVMLNQFHNPYSSVVCDDGLRITFTEFRGYQFLAISFDEEESAVVASRRLKVSVKITNMLYGSAMTALKREFLGGSSSRPKLMSSLINKWEKLRSEEQSFLVEAVERVLVNKTVSLTCLKLLENVVDSMKKCLLAPYSSSHAVLFIGSKLLSLYSSRSASSLTPTDILLLTILTNTVHSRDKKLRHVGVTASLQLSRESSVSGHSVDCSSEPNQKQSTSKIGKLKQRAALLQRFAFGETKDVTLKKVNRHMDISYHLLFLHTQHGPSVPHIVYNIRIISGVVLVIITDASKGLLSKCIVKSMDVLLAILCDKSMVKCKEAADLLDSSMTKMFTLVRQHKLTMEAQRTLRITALKWDQVQKLGFMDYLQNSNSSTITPRIEAAVSSLCENLREVFHHVLYSSELLWEQYIPAIVQVTLEQLQLKVKNALSDYLGYLLVKSDRNITMTSYAHDYPGLLHFIYVDRTNHHVTAPALNTGMFQTSDNNADADMESISQEKIWDMVEFIQKQLQLGHTSIMWRDDQHYYTYFLWFEDSAGNPLSSRKSALNLHHLPLPGALNGEFYRLYTEECFPNVVSDKIQCYELFCVHVGATSAAFIINFSRRLAAQVWEIAGSAGSTSNLL